jgi:hypothetical protein
MSIPLSKYVNITSAVGGGSNVAIRQLIGAIFTGSPLIDALNPLIFGGGPTAALAAVGSYFGTASEEYARAQVYFSYVSPAVRTPQSILFAQSQVAVQPASVYGETGSYVYTAFTGITAGLLSFNFAGTTVAVTGINLSTATSLSTVASILQTALRLNADTHLTTCTVTYDAVNSKFDFIASNSGVVQGTFSMVQVGTVGTTDVANALGWYVSQGALNISSSPILTPLQAFTNAVNITNNFGSFCFTTASALTLLQQEAVASYNASLNLMFQYQIMVTPANYVATQAALATTSGVGLTYQLSTLNQYPEMIPMAIEAATDYTMRNGVTNFMYRQVPNISASVTGNTTDPVSYTALDAALVNYYGSTQQAGQNVNFYQNGVLQGLSTSPQSMNTFANEQWLKSYVASAILSLQLALPQLSANSVGKSQLLSVIQSAINLALFNGTISIWKTLTNVQQIYITSLTGDNNAWIQVQNIGYWVNVTITSAVVNGITVYTANYTLIYAKNDAVRNVVGSHVLI